MQPEKYELNQRLTYCFKQFLKSEHEKRYNQYPNWVTVGPSSNLHQKFQKLKDRSPVEFLNEAIFGSHGMLGRFFEVKHIWKSDEIKRSLLSNFHREESSKQTAFIHQEKKDIYIYFQQIYYNRFNKNKWSEFGVYLTVSRQEGRFFVKKPVSYQHREIENTHVRLDRGNTQRLIRVGLFKDRETIEEQRRLQNLVLGDVNLGKKQIQLYFQRQDLAHLIQNQPQNIRGIKNDFGVFLDNKLQGIRRRISGAEVETIRKQVDEEWKKSLGKIRELVEGDQQLKQFWGELKSLQEKFIETLIEHLEEKREFGLLYLSDETHYNYLFAKDTNSIEFHSLPADYGFLLKLLGEVRDYLWKKLDKEEIGSEKWTMITGPDNILDFMNAIGFLNGTKNSCLQGSEQLQIMDYEQFHKKKQKLINPIFRFYSRLGRPS